MNVSGLGLNMMTQRCWCSLHMPRSRVSGYPMARVQIWLPIVACCYLVTYPAYCLYCTSSFYDATANMHKCALDRDH